MAHTPEFRIGVLAGGQGTTFESVHQATQTGVLADTEISFVISNNGPDNRNAQIWQKAYQLHTPIYHVSNKTEDTCTLPIVGDEPIGGTISYEVSERMLQLADDYYIHMYVALGFMKKIIGKVLQEIPFANVHRGPLPETAGKSGNDIEETVMKQGLEYSGPTFHWMNKKVDEHGLPIYDLDPKNLGLRIGHQPVRVTAAMRQEWQDSNTATLLRAEVMDVEKQWVSKWIRRALEQLAT